MGNNPIADWDQELASERELRTKLYELRKDESDAGKKLRRKASREWFAQVSRIMQFCLNESRYGEFKHKLPVDVWADLYRLTDDFSRGLVPEIVRDVAGRGRNPVGRTEENDIGYASAYLQAVEDGKVHDKTHTKSISDAYGISRKAAQRWKKKKVPDAIRERVQDSDFLTKMVHRHGEYYKKAGRSASAINRRDNKRK